MCVDYRPLNSATVKDQTPLPSHTDLRDRVRDCPYLTKLDIRDAFHMIKIDPPDRHKTSFKTRYGLFQYKVMPFGLSNAPATFTNV